MANNDTFSIQLLPGANKYFTGVLPKLNKAMERGLSAGLHQAGFLIVKTLKDGIQRQKKLGRVYKRKGKNKRASAPGQYAGIVTRDYIKSANFEVGNAAELTYGFTDRKATWLEEGTKRMKPRPALALATSERESDTFNILAKNGIKVIEQLGKAIET